MVTVLGWVWVWIGIFASLGSLFLVLFGLLWKPLMNRMLLEDPPPSGATDLGEMIREDLGGPPILAWLAEHVELAFIFQLALAVLVLVAGARLLAQRRWARSFLEGMCWLHLVYVVAFSVFFSVVWFTMVSTIPVDDALEQPFPVEAFAWFGVVGAFVNAMFHGGLLAVLIFFLRHRTVRENVF